MERCLLGGASAGSQGRGGLGAAAAAAGGRWGAPAGEGGSGRRPTSMRPSMEMRRRKLDTSMLQARACRLGPRVRATAARGTMTRRRL